MSWLSRFWEWFKRWFKEWWQNAKEEQRQKAIEEKYYRRIERESMANELGKLKARRRIANESSQQDFNLFELFYPQREKKNVVDNSKDKKQAL